ncbi:MAG: amidase [Myxococcales bacterium]|nr:amidase [Myxococcales bacterium]
MNPLLELSAVELAAKIRAREVSPVEVVETHVRRIEEVNGRLNAVVRPLFSAAHAEARAAERRLAAREADLPPFLGVPFTSKEHLEVRGLPNTGGLVRRRNVVAPRDATVVARMKEAGFVLLGTTNVPEGLTWYECYNKVYGRTSNAYSARHTPGGSSGGEGAIIGAGGSPIGIGGDMGGSIRLPAFFNGIAGHKPSGGRMPETGAWPGARGLIARYKVLGPMARRVSDLRAVMPILARPDGKDLSVDGPSWTEESLSPRDVHASGCAGRCGARRTRSRCSRSRRSRRRSPRRRSGASRWPTSATRCSARSRTSSDRTACSSARSSTARPPATVCTRCCTSSASPTPARSTRSSSPRPRCPPASTTASRSACRCSARATATCSR